MHLHPISCGNNAESVAPYSYIVYMVYVDCMGVSRLLTLRSLSIFQEVFKPSYCLFLCVSLLICKVYWSSFPLLTLRSLSIFQEVFKPSYCLFLCVSLLAFRCCCVIDLSLYAWSAYALLRPLDILQGVLDVFACRCRRFGLRPFRFLTYLKGFTPLAP